MSAAQSTPWFHSNRYNEQSACEFCGGMIRHEFWCLTRNPQVTNAWEAVTDSAKLDLHDHLILHALGVSWKDACQDRASTHETASGPLPVTKH